MNSLKKVLIPIAIGLVVFANAYHLIRNSLPPLVSSVLACLISLGAAMAALTIWTLRQKELQRAKLDAAHLKQMTSVLPGIMYECEISPTGEVRVTYVNEAVRDVLGLEPESLMEDATYFMQFVHPDDREELQKKTREHCASLQPWRWEYRYVVPKLGIRWVESRGKVQRRENGLLIWNGFIIDITERRAMEERLRLGEERLALATRAGRIGTWDYDIIQQTVTWNDVMYEQHEMTPEAYSPDPKRDILFIHPEDRERTIQEFIDHFKSDATSCEVTYRMILPSNRTRYIRSSALILRNSNGQAIRVVGISRDFTEEQLLDAELARARDAAEDSTRAKSEFLAVMSHEIRTPMNGIMGYIGLLKETPLNDEQRQCIEIVETSSESLLRLINDVLDLASVESRHTSIDPKDFHLGTCIAECINILRPVALSKGLALSFHLDKGVPEWICADRLRVTQILVNLLGNAVKFTETGNVRMNISTELHGGDARQRQWKFCVEDTGPGIPKEQLPRIFDPFFQGDTFEVRRHRGTGLGLTISQHLAQLMGGAITVTSEEGRGSTFCLTIHAPIGSPLAVLPEEPTATVLPAINGNGRILIVEDDAISRILCHRLLDRFGFQSDSAESGYEALDKCEKSRYDLVLMDMQMPGLSGCDTTRRIRDNEAVTGNQPTPIIALTANAMERDRAACLDAGMNDFLTKPIKMDHLSSVLRRWIAS